jgi:anti-sigma B factor antagonist
MRLTLHSQLIQDVAVIRCEGRIVWGAEVDALEAELEKQTKIPGTKVFKVKRVVLQMAQVNFIDSSGLGALVRMAGVMRAAGGDVRLCELSPTVFKVLQITKLSGVFTISGSEREALDAYFKAPGSPYGSIAPTTDNIVCVDPSKDLLAYLKALLKGAGYETATARTVKEGITLANAMKPRVVICGPGLPGLPGGEEAVAGFRRMGPNLHVLVLPSDFSTAEAGQAGADLVEQVKALL